MNAFPGRSRQGIFEVVGQVMRWINRHLMTTAYFRAREYDANQPELDASRTSVGAGLTYRF